MGNTLSCLVRDNEMINTNLMVGIHVDMLSPRSGNRGNSYRLHLVVNKIFLPAPLKVSG